MAGQTGLTTAAKATRPPAPFRISGGRKHSVAIRRPLPAPCHPGGSHCPPWGATAFLARLDTREPCPDGRLASEFALCSLPKGTSWLESQELIPLTSLDAKGFTAPARQHLKECRRCVSASGKYDLIQGILLFWTCQGLLLCTILGHFECGQGGQWKEIRKEGKGPQQSSMSFQFSCSVMSDSLRLLGLQHARPPCPSPAPGVYSNSCPLSR